MRIKKLTDSSVLKPGELLVVLHCLNQCGFDPLGGLRKSIGAGVVPSYRHRREPVPWIGRSKNGRLFRRPRTTNERRAHFSNEAIEEILESHGLAFKLRQRRNSDRLPNAHDDLSLRYQLKLERASRSTAKDRKQHRPPNPQPSLLGLVRARNIKARRERPMFIQLFAVHIIIFIT